MLQNVSFVQRNVDSEWIFKNIKYFFLFVFPPVWQLALYLSPTFFPLFSSFPSLSPETSFFYRQSPSFLTARVTPHENVTAAILSYAVSHLHEGTEKLRKTCADTVGHLTESVPSLTKNIN